MSTQEKVQKKPTATMSASHAQNSFAPRGFTVQSKADKVSNQQTQQSPNLKTQLSRATRFGHNLSQMPTVKTKTATAPGNQTIQRQVEDELEQMKSEQSAQLATQQPPAQETASSGSGNSIPGALRAKMENSFGASFSDVNIHTNSAQAKSIGALAYTQGNNVHFASGQYNPESPSGQALLGHELTHVVQQRAGRVAVPHQSKGAPINADPSLEQEADEMGAKAARGELVQMPGAGGFSVSSASPVQNSTEPVQCLGPLALLGGLTMGLDLFNGVKGLFGGGGGSQQPAPPPPAMAPPMMGPPMMGPMMPPMMGPMMPPMMGPMMPPMMGPMMGSMMPPMMDPMMGSMMPPMMDPMMGSMMPPMMDPMMGSMMPPMMDPSMLGMMGQQMGAMLPQLQGQMMQQPMSNEMNQQVQGGGQQQGGGGKGNPLSKIGGAIGGIGSKVGGMFGKGK